MLAPTNVQHPKLFSSLSERAETKTESQKIFLQRVLNGSSQPGLSFLPSNKKEIDGVIWVKLSVVYNFIGY